MSFQLDAANSAIDLPLTSFLPRRYRPHNPSTWSGHLAFANDLIAAVRPSLIVELGTHWGESYFTFCQSVFENTLDCLCYAVDNWVGEPHAGFYGEEVYQDVSSYNETHYRAFSYLLKDDFDNALPQFANDSIDILHIDGLHTYDAVSRDFRNWFAKVSPGGIILMHDIVARHADFGVWRLWNELKAEFEDTFEFHHWWGLGVLRKPGTRSLRPSLLGILFSGEHNASEHVRRHYVVYSGYLESLHINASETAAQGAPEDSGRTIVQVFLGGTEGYSETRSLTKTIRLGEWENITFDLLQGVSGPIRLDLGNCPAVVHVSRIAVIHTYSGAVLWASDSPDVLKLKARGSATMLPGASSLFLLSYGSDPGVILPEFPYHGGALCLELLLRIDGTPEAMYEALNQHYHLRLNATEQEVERYNARLSESTAAHERSKAEYERRLEELRQGITACNGKLADFGVQLRASETERMLAVSDFKQAVAEANHLRRELRLAEQAITGSARQRESEIVRLQQQLDLLQTELVSTQDRLRSEHEIKQGILRSVSWKITRPGRTLMETARKVLRR